jgi:hypothetical protein
MVTSYYERGSTGVGGTNVQIARANLANLRYAASRRYAAPSAKAGPSMPAASRKAWEQAIAQYAPGGGYGKGVEAGLERGRTKALASGTQSLVSAGLYGTTTTAGLGKKYEEESTRAQAIASLKAGYAGAMQSGYESAADRSLRMNLASMQDIGQSFDQMPTSERIGPDQLAMQETLAKMRTHEGQVPNPFGTDRKGGYSPPLPGWGGGITSPQPGLASMYT